MKKVSKKKCNHNFQQFLSQDGEAEWEWADKDPAHFARTQFFGDKIFTLFCTKCAETKRVRPNSSA